MTVESRTKTVGVIFPTGMIGAGFPIEMIRRGVELGADAIAIDAGSTDSGPYYLGTGTAKVPAAAIARDLRTLIIVGREAGIPVIVGSCGTAGTAAGVRAMGQMAREIARSEGLRFTLAEIFSDLTPAGLAGPLAQGRIRPLPPMGELDMATLESCEHIVGLMGHDPIVNALEAGADVVLAGRATDTAMVAAVGLMNGLPPGPVWHAGKTVECGGMCTTNPRSAGGSSPVYVEIDEDGFTVTPLDDASTCTPTSVAAHMLYENTDPDHITEPSGMLDASASTYTALDDRVVRVEGSAFRPSEQPTIKLEGSRLVGYETMSLVGIADPHVVANVDEWMQSVERLLVWRVRDVLGLEPHEYRIDFRCFGKNAVLGPLSPDTGRPSEVGVLMKVMAADQATATAIAKTANPLLLHQPLPDMTYAPSFAFVTSPAETELGPAYEFALNHIVEVDSSTELFVTEMAEVGGNG